MFRAIAIRVIVYGLLVFPILIYTMQPLIEVHQKDDAALSNVLRLKTIVQTLVDFGPRDSKHPDVLKKVADWLAQDMTLPGARVTRQSYTVKNESFENIRVNFGPDAGPRIIIGAHFDAYRGLPGADDNGSGVAVLLELARLLSAQPPPVPVELVAWNLEEPPFFRTENMGSRIHARSLKEEGVPVKFAVSLESLGTYSEAPKSQSYPLPGMGVLYPDRGNFLALVGNYGSGWLLRKSKERMQEATSLPIWSINAPSWLVGIDFSDHGSYWKEGYPAFMVTGTAFYRNKRYHTPQDTPDQLDYEQMARVVQAVYGLIPKE
jgi:hypothetical protein